MSEKLYKCECCHREFDEEEYQMTLDKNKCIFHCRKNLNNNWLVNEIYEKNYHLQDDYENAKVRWNQHYIRLFWKKFIDDLSVQQNDIEIENYIFPIYWILQYQHDSILNTIKDKKIRFNNCVFLDYIFLENQKIEKVEIKRFSFINGCKFKKSINFDGLNFIDGITILNSNFENKLNFFNCNFNYLFEIVNSCLNELNLINIKTQKSIEINYNLEKSFNLNIYSVNINELKISGNNLNDLMFQSSKIKKLHIDDNHHKLINYIFNKIEISEKSEIDNLILDNVKVNEYLLLDTYLKEKSTMIKSKFAKTFFNNIKFSGITDFSEAEFSDNVNFKLCLFGEVLFRKTKFLKGLDFSNSSFYKRNIFLGIEVNTTNRETARIIKNSFEQQNNIIEANKFYALEMKEREKELSWKNDFFEKLIFSFHGLSSNHSQNWLLPIFWIVFFGLLNSYFQPLNFYTMNYVDVLYKEFFVGL
ncbi:pentapeptide repeat-containing protein [Arcobacter arenosus]|uniref:pentapeptide repeat-containing protein n=1 Tax=Arcobacter arenosus TaxID=2576037 RepID=UPI003BAB5F6A